MLVTTSSSALLAQILEVAALKACFLVLAADSVPMLDLVNCAEGQAAARAWAECGGQIMS